MTRTLGGNKTANPTKVKAFVEAKMQGKSNAAAAREAGYSAGSIAAVEAIKLELQAARRWLTDVSQIKRLDVSRERESWTDQQKLEHALDSFGFADSFGTAADVDTDGFAAPLARSELGNGAKTIFEKFKKGV